MGVIRTAAGGYPAVSANRTRPPNARYPQMHETPNRAAFPGREAPADEVLAVDLSDD